MPSYKAGQEIDAYCTRCKMDLLHKIVAVANNKPVKVECRTCYTTHAYRPPKGVHAPGETPIAGVPSPSNAGGGTSVSPRRRVPVEAVPVVPPQGAHIHVYRMTERFSPESWIQHKVFGMGLVLREVPPDKIEVRFDEGSKMLVHGKSP